MITRARTVAVVVAAAVAVAVSGCSSVVAGRPVAESGGTDAAATRWVDVSGTPVPHTDARGMQFSPDGLPYPGALVRHRDPAMASGWAGCTLGPAVTGPSGTGFITAGHCAQPDPLQQLQTDTMGQELVPLGEATEAAVSDYGGDDSALVPATLPGSSVTRIADTFPIVGVMTAEAVQALPVGTPVCESGAVDRVVCGALVSVDPDVQFRRFPAPAGGDSGSIVFVVDGDSHTAVLVGIHHGHTAEDVNVATAGLLEPALERLGARALLDPGTPPRTGVNYSISVIAAQ